MGGEGVGRGVVEVEESWVGVVVADGPPVAKVDAGQIPKGDEPP